MSPSKLGTLWPRRQKLAELAAAIDRLVSVLDPGDSAGAERGEAPDLTQLSERISALAGEVERRLGGLAEKRAHLETVLGSLSEGVLVTDGEGRTVMANDAWRVLFSVSGRVEGATALELTRQTALDRMIGETLASGDGSELELEIGRGRRRTVIVTSSPLTDGAGVVLLARDLTPILQVGEIRRDFVANVSHELKTPLSAIRGFAETLHDGALGDPVAAARFTERILRQCQRLEALLTDLLTLSRLEHPAAATGWRAIDLRALVAEAVDLIRDAAVDRGLKITAELAPVPAFEGDPEALERLSINLLENAIKYNRPKGSVAVRLDVDEGEAVLEVTDTGIGIPPASLERLFERFYRVDKGRSREEGGTGLGLAIVKHAAQLHGGRVEVESDLDSGTTFRVVLPLAGGPVAAL